MKRFLYKIASTLMALIVLISTFSFTVEKHYCGDFLVGVSYVGSASFCDVKIDSSSDLKVNNCCKNEIEHVEGQNELHNNSIEKLIFEQQKGLVGFAFYFQNLFENTQFVEEYFKDFPPPNLYRNYQVLHQSFLI
jgi:hypothetical protein